MIDNNFELSTYIDTTYYSFQFTMYNYKSEKKVQLKFYLHGGLLNCTLGPKILHEYKVSKT